MLFCNVNHSEFELVNEFEKQHVLYIEVRLKNRGCRCTNYGIFHTSIKEYKLKRILHSIYAHQESIILFHQRRFICPNCKKTSMETNPFITNNDSRVSDQIIENVLKDRDKHTISSYLSSIPLQERKNAQYVLIDINEYYRDVVRFYLKDATIIAHSFHVVKQINSTLDSVRKRIMHRYIEQKHSDEYYLLKYYDQLLYSKCLSYERKKNRHFNYFISENNMLEMMLDIDPQLKKVYLLAQDYIRFNDTDYKGDFVKIYNRLESIINDYKISGIDDFYRLSLMLENWKVEICNSFSIVKEKRISNGPMEGRNSLIKKIIRLANGYTNFIRFRNRIIYCLNKFSDHSFKK